MKLPFILCSVLSAIPPHATAAEHASAKPNFVLCMADDQGWGDMAYNGHPTLKTPASKPEVTWRRGPRCGPPTAATRLTA